MDLARIEELLLSRVGLYFPPETRPILEIKIKSRMTALGLGSVGDYWRLLVSSRDEFQELVNIITVSETYFMREYEQLSAAARFLASKRGTLRLLSAGSASGEELYSMIILLSEEGVPLYKIQGVGLDINTRALEVAKKGVYGPRSLRTEKGRKALMKHLEKSKDGLYILDERIRERAMFLKRNILDPMKDLGRFDAIMCRNTLIYIHPDKRRQVFENFREVLTPDGLLVLGQIEVLGGTYGLFRPVRLGGKTLYLKEAGRES